MKLNVNKFKGEDYRVGVRTKKQPNGFLLIGEVFKLKKNSEWTKDYASIVGYSKGEYKEALTKVLTEVENKLGVELIRREKIAV